MPLVLLVYAIFAHYQVYQLIIRIRIFQRLKWLSAKTALGLLDILSFKDSFNSAIL